MICSVQNPLFLAIVNMLAQSLVDFFCFNGREFKPLK